MNEAAGWWDIAQKLGSGAAFVMGVSLFYLWKAYREELKYSKDRDMQTMTVLLTLTKVVEKLETNDKMFETRQEQSTQTIMTAINDLKSTVMTHMSKNP